MRSSVARMPSSACLGIAPILSIGRCRSLETSHVSRISVPSATGSSS